MRLQKLLVETIVDKILATNGKSLLETALGTFDLKTMSKEEITGLYDTLSKSGLKKA